MKKLRKKRNGIRVASGILLALAQLGLAQSVERQDKQISSYGSPPDATGDSDEDGLSSLQESLSKPSNRLRRAFNWSMTLLPT